MPPASVFAAALIESVESHHARTAKLSGAQFTFAANIEVDTVHATEKKRQSERQVVQSKHG